MVAASGNDGTSEYMYPASYPGVVAVGAVDESGNRASFSNYNDKVDFAGPGVRVYSTSIQNGYSISSGTSFAGKMPGKY